MAQVAAAQTVGIENLTVNIPPATNNVLKGLNVDPETYLNLNLQGNPFLKIDNLPIENLNFGDLNLGGNNIENFISITSGGLGSFAISGLGLLTSQMRHNQLIDKLSKLEGKIDFILVELAEIKRELKGIRKQLDMISSQISRVEEVVALQRTIVAEEDVLTQMAWWVTHWDRMIRQGTTANVDEFVRQYNAFELALNRIFVQAGKSEVRPEFFFSMLAAGSIMKDLIDLRFGFASGSVDEVDDRNRVRQWYKDGFQSYLEKIAATGYIAPRGRIAHTEINIRDVDPLGVRFEKYKKKLELLLREPLPSGWNAAACGSVTWERYRRDQEQGIRTRTAIIEADGIVGRNSAYSIGDLYQVNFVNSARDIPFLIFTEERGLREGVCYRPHPDIRTGQGIMGHSNASLLVGGNVQVLGLARLNNGRFYFKRAFYKMGNITECKTVCWQCDISQFEIQRARSVGAPTERESHRRLYDLEKCDNGIIKRPRREIPGVGIFARSMGWLRDKDRHFVGRGKRMIKLANQYKAAMDEISVALLAIDEAARNFEKAW